MSVREGLQPRSSRDAAGAKRSGADLLANLARGGGLGGQTLLGQNVGVNFAVARARRP